MPCRYASWKFDRESMVINLFWSFSLGKNRLWNSTSASQTQTIFSTNMSTASNQILHAQTINFKLQFSSVINWIIIISICICLKWSTIICCLCLSEALNLGEAAWRSFGDASFVCHKLNNDNFNFRYNIVFEMISYYLLSLPLWRPWRSCMKVIRLHATSCLVASSGKRYWFATIPHVCKQ